MNRPVLNGRPLILLSLTLGLAFAGGGAQDPQQAGRQIGAALLGGQPLKTLLLAERFEQGSRRTDAHDYALQTLSQTQAFVGLTQDAVHTADDGASAPPPLTPQARARLEAATPLNAVPAIVAAARGHQIVILNEAHHVPQGRAFAQQLALALRQEGFRYFAAETFSPGVAASVKAGYPTLASGYYSAEPQFGNLIRAALGAGYTLVPYESETPAPGDDFTASINHREAEEARNLNQRIFQRDPQARVFIYVGYSHASERPEGSGRTEVRWMAARLKALTGLDPLTIDQTTGFAHSAARFDDPAYTLLNRRRVLGSPKVLRQPDGTFFVGGSFAGQVDLQVFHPCPVLTSGRPDWLALNGARRPVPVPLKANNGRRLLQAYPTGEPDDAVPVDQVVVGRDVSRVTLMLPSGRYRLTLQDEAGTRISLRSLTQP